MPKCPANRQPIAFFEGSPGKQDASSQSQLKSSQGCTVAHVAPPPCNTAIELIAFEAGESGACGLFDA
jgi:hypothetical protein